jgi:tetratricopeptide (TPR) repeat protein
MVSTQSERQETGVVGERQESMELKLKPISRAGVAEAISKAEVYRYLNEPGEAESICRDILALEPNNQTALRLLGLAITDQFTGKISDRYIEAGRAFQSLTSDYERVYYTGILHERKAKAQLRAGQPPHTVLPVFEDAMRFFEEAEKIRPPDNDEAILRWNRCVRLLESRMGTEWKKEMEEFDASEGPPV